MSFMMNCEPCGKSFTGPVSYNQHIESEKHKRKVSSLKFNTNEKKVLNTSKILSLNSPEHSRDPFECSTCSLRFNSIEDVQTHSLSQEHAKRILEIAQMEIENAKNMVSLIIGDSDCSNNVENNSNAISDESDTILPEVEMMKSQASFSFCKTCKKSFSGPEPYKQHIESAGHIKKTELEKKISLGINVATSEFSCAPCKKTFSGLVPYEQHINSNIHRKKIQSLQLYEKFEVDSNLKVNKTVMDPGPSNKEGNPWYCKTCDVICSGPAPFEQHMNSNIHRKKIQSLQLLEKFEVDSDLKVDNTVMQPDPSNKGNLWYCKTCDVICSGPAPFDQHNKGGLHLKNFLKAQREKGIGDILSSNLQINRLNMPKEDVMPGLMDNDKGAHTAKLHELITVFFPEDEINFNEQKNSNLNSAELKIDSGEQNNNFNLAKKNADELELIQITSNACSLAFLEKENISGNEIEEKSNVYQICNYCNVKLFSKDEAINHYESLEHYQRRWS